MNIINTQRIRDVLSTVLSEGNKEEAKTGWVNPYDGQKSTVLLETRIFNETPVNPIQCFNCLTKVLNLIINKGVSLSPQEETSLFFGVTKLFQSSNDRLRRMLYLAIKTLTINEGEAFIVTSSLTKDINSGSDLYRANALRVLSKIVDSSMVSQIERYLKTAIVDKSPFVASSALVCGMRLLSTSQDLIKRWVNEVTESVKSKNVMVQFHALALLYELKKYDRLALQKVVGSLVSTPLKSPFAECLLIRYSTKILKSERSAELEKRVVEYLNSRLQYRSDMTVLEAARALCSLACCASAGGKSGDLRYAIDLRPALSALQIMISSRSSPIRFAAVRVLDRLAGSRPELVSQCNAEMEALLSDANRSIATLALTALLKTVHESGVERLIKQISSLMTDIPDGFKIEIIKAVRQLSVNYPFKRKTLLEFLSSQLREESSYEVKRDLVNAIISVTTENPSTIEFGLLHLCEFIEDCEYPTLSTRVLCWVGETAPSDSNASKFVRFLYNRLILENAAVRAAAVDALCKIGYACPELSRDISVLLECCLADSDDEIRDRSRLYTKALRHRLQAEFQEPSSFVGGDESTVASSSSVVTLDDLLILDESLSVDALVDYTKQWLLESSSSSSSVAAAAADSAGDSEAAATLQQLDISTLPSEDEYRKIAAAAAVAAAAVAAEAAALTPSAKRAAAEPPSSMTAVKSPRESAVFDISTEIQKICSAVCPNETLGHLDHSTHKVALTEKEAEYSVNCNKHFFDSGFVALEFEITNTMTHQVLENLSISLTSFDSSVWSVICCPGIDRLEFDSPISTYCLLKKQEGAAPLYSVGSFTVTLNYLLKEENDEFGVNDSYPVEPVNILIADYVTPHKIRQGEFKSRWASLAEYGDSVAKLSLKYPSLESAVAGITAVLNLAPCEDSENVQSGSVSQDLLLAGISFRGPPILAKCMVLMSPKHGCLAKVICRSQNLKLREALLTAFD